MCTYVSLFFSAPGHLAKNPTLQVRQVMPKLGDTAREEWGRAYRDVWLLSNPWPSDSTLLPSFCIKNENFSDPKHFLICFDHWIMCMAGGGWVGRHFQLLLLRNKIPGLTNVTFARKIKPYELPWGFPVKDPSGGQAKVW